MKKMWFIYYEGFMKVILTLKQLSRLEGTQQLLLESLDRCKNSPHLVHYSRKCKFRWLSKEKNVIERLTGTWIKIEKLTAILRTTNPYTIVANNFPGRSFARCTNYTVKCDFSARFEAIVMFANWFIISVKYQYFYQQN